MLDELRGEMAQLMPRAPAGYVLTLRRWIQTLDIARSGVHGELPGMGSVPAADRGRGDQVEVMKFVQEIGLTAGDAQWFFWKCEGCGWKNNGKPILNWRATVRAWEKARIFPSQKQAGPVPGAPMTGADKMVAIKDLDRVEASLKTLYYSYDEHRDMPPAEKLRLKALKGRRAELLAKLGMTSA